MCGIAGLLSLSNKPVFEEEVVAMCDAMVHRGPDDAGYYADDRAAMGMRRLSIIDLSTGHQPVHNEDKTIWMVFNGEIYNFRELRSELAVAGHRFYPASDTETIVHAYEEWGTAAIGKLRGMFGLAIWDMRSRTLLIARDRIGIKPLHYAVVNGRFFFGSEIKSLLEAPDLPRELDIDALD